VVKSKVQADKTRMMDSDSKVQDARCKQYKVPVRILRGTA
jgi:hypothetical protein